MLVTISPAKKLNWSETPAGEMTKPELITQANALAKIAGDLSADDLRKLMKISDDLARLNWQRFQDYSTRPTAAALRPAVYAFAGDTYQGLEARTLDADAISYAQSHLRILSGLYGVLRPLDQMQAYRLEMGSRLKNPKGANLYAYWGDQIAKTLNKTAQEAGTDVLINCASTEYFGAVDQDALKLRVITPVFYDTKNGEQKIISFFAKQARGAMARFVVESRIKDPHGLRDFNSGGYAFDPAQSDDTRVVFTR